MPKAFLIDIERCFGCHACEVGCQMHHGLPTDQFGVKVAKLGPWEYAPEQWQYDYVPTFTKQCDACEERVEQGKKPLCVQTCGGNALELGELADIAARAHDRQIIQVL